MDEIMLKIKHAVTMEEMDAMRDDIVAAGTSESLLAWQKKYRGMKTFRKPADKGYRRSWILGE